MNEATRKLLKKCQEYGLKRVCIGVRHKIVPESMGFPFSPVTSIFGIVAPKADSDVEGSPAIWRVVDELGISTGAGNTNQHTADLSGIEMGAYRFYGGQWKKLT